MWGEYETIYIFSIIRNAACLRNGYLIGFGCCHRFALWQLIGRRGDADNKFFKCR